MKIDCAMCEHGEEIGWVDASEIIGAFDLPLIVNGRRTKALIRGTQIAVLIDFDAETLRQMLRGAKETK